MDFIRNIFIITVTFSIAILQACTYSKVEPQPACANVPDTVSFKNEILPILTNNCALSGCHVTPNPQSGLNLSASTAYSQLLKPGKGYVVPRNFSYSTMYIQITTATQIMPPTGKMDDCSIDVIKLWIQQGAKNN